MTQRELVIKDFTNTLLSMNFDADVVFLGASITSDGKWEEYFPEVRICTLGYSGDKLESMMARVPQVSSVCPKMIFVAPEQNNLHSSSIEEIEKSLCVLLDSIQISNSHAKIFLESLLPLNKIKFRSVCDNKKIEKVNQMLKAVAESRHIVYLNLYDLNLENGQLPTYLSTDGQHLKHNAYKRWADMIEPYINEIIK